MPASFSEAPDGRKLAGKARSYKSMNRARFIRLMAGGIAGAALHRDVDLLVGGEGLDHVGDKRDAALSLGCLFRHSDLHLKMRRGSL